MRSIMLCCFYTLGELLGFVNGNLFKELMVLLSDNLNFTLFLFYWPLHLFTHTHTHTNQNVLIDEAWIWIWVQILLKPDMVWHDTLYTFLIHEFLLCCWHSTGVTYNDLLCKHISLSLSLSLSLLVHIKMSLLGCIHAK
jgi:hypothetical protein